MKRPIYIISLVFVIVSITALSNLDSQELERADITESITPGNAIMYAKTSRITTLVKSINYFLDSFIASKEDNKISRGLKKFQDKTGIDPRNIESIKKSGIDVNRSISMAYFRPGSRNEDRLVLYIPVVDEKKSPLKFVEILKKMSGSNNMDLYPVMTSYRDYTINQSQKDLFTTVIDGVLVVASTGELLRKVIDVKLNKEGHLDSDKLYNEFREETSSDFDVSFFARKEFLKEILSSILFRKKLERQIEKKNTGYNTRDHVTLIPAQSTGDNTPRKKSRRLQDFNRGPSPLNSIDYAFLGIGLKTGKLNVRFGTRFADSNAAAESILSIIKTGVTGKALHVEDLSAYGYLSIDFSKVEEMCKKDQALCNMYRQFKNRITRELGLDFASDIMPGHSGAINFLLGQSIGIGGGSYLVYLPMNDAAKSKKMWNKSRKYLKKTVGKDGRFGELKIGKHRSFWYTDYRNKKNFFVVDKRGIYAGNDVSLIKKALAGKNLESLEDTNTVKQIMGSSIFLMGYIKRDSFLGSLLMMQSSRLKIPASFMEKVGDIYLYGGKDKRTVSFDLDVEIRKDKSQ